MPMFDSLMTTALPAALASPGLFGGAMASSAALAALLAVYAAASAAYLSAVATTDDRARKLARWLLLAAAVLHGLLLMATLLDPQRGGLSVADLVLLAASWLVSGGYLFGSTMRSMPLSGPVLSSFVAVMVGAVAFRHLWPTTVHLPSQAGWIKPFHISVSVLAFWSFAAAAAMAVAYLVKEQQLRNRQFDAKPRLPSLQELERWSGRAVLIGFPLFSVGLLFGGVTASRAMAGGGGVEPQYLLSVLAWIIYALLLHARLTLGWQGRRSAVATIVAFLPTFGTVLLYALRGAA